MPTPSSRERAREIVGRCLCVKTLEPVGPVYGANIKCLPCQMAGRITAAIDAAVEEEREACARLLSALFASSKFRDPREVQTAVTEGQKLIRARGGDRE